MRAGVGARVEHVEHGDALWSDRCRVGLDDVMVMDCRDDVLRRRLLGR